MSRKTQRYSKEFKAEAVRTVLENQLSISEGASRLSLPEGTLGQWVTAARKGLRTAVNDFMDSVHHIWCPLFSQEFQDLPDSAETTLTYGPAFPAIVDCYTSPPT